MYVGTHHIEPSTQIMIQEPVLINGFTQAGSSQNTTNWPYPMDSIIRIEISLVSTESLRVESPNVELRGLIVNLGTGTALDLTGADNFKLAGSYIHTDYTGLRVLREDDPLVQGYDQSLEVISIKGSEGVDIGGDSAAERNIVGGCTNFCILAKADGDNLTTNLNIEGNYLTVGADWLTSVGQNDQGRGIGVKEGTTNVTINKNSLERVFFDPLYISDSDYVSFTGNRVFTSGTNPFEDGPGGYTVSILGSRHITIGSSEPDGRNLFGGLKAGGIIVTDSNSNRTSEDVVIENNSFGYAGDDATAFPNTDNAIFVSGESEFINIKGNRIHNTNKGNAADGVRVVDSANEVSIVGNSIYNNSDLGIDLANEGPDTNDSLDVDSGANDQLNYPEWYGVAEASGDTIVDFTADLPAGDYRIEFFSNTQADVSGRGEGEVYLGYTTITSTGAPNNFSHSLTGITGVTNLALTATEIDGSSPNGFGATSEFGGEGSMYVAPNDLTIQKTLDDPENYAPGNTVEYTITLTNTGENPIDLTSLDGLSDPNPLTSGLFSDMTAPGMTFNSVVSGDVSCTPIGTFGSLDPGNPLWANHQDYGVVACPYTGSETSFQPNDTISVTISIDLATDLNVGQPNTAVSGGVEGDEGQNVIGDCISAALQPGATQDVLDCVLADTSGEADIAQAGAPTDIDIAQTFSAPNGVFPGSAVSFTYTLTNNGPGDVSLPWYRITSPLFTNIFPGEDLSFVNSTSNVPGVICFDLGPGTAMFLGDVAEEHSSYNLILCSYGGAENSTLTSGDSITVTVSAMVNEGSDGQFMNYLMHSSTPSDPDSVSMYQLIASTTSDQLDTALGYSMLSRLSYPLGSSPSGGGNNSGSSSVSSPDAALSNTGQSIKALMVLGLALVLIACLVSFITKKEFSRGK